MVLLDGMGNGHIIDIYGLHKEALIKIFNEKGGIELLDRVTDNAENKKVIQKWFSDYTLAIQL